MLESMSESKRDQPGHGVRMVDINAGQAGQRIDNFLLRVLKGVPRSRIYRILRRGEVRVNGGRIQASHRLVEGDKVRIPPLRAPRQSAVGVPEGLCKELERSIIFEDDRLIVINKPAGLAVHAGSGLRFGVIEAMRQLRPNCTSLELVHRLDRGTSGCLLISKSRDELHGLHDLLRTGKIEKRYLALLAGRLKEDRVICDAPLRAGRRSGIRHVAVDPGGRECRSEFIRLQSFRSATLVEVLLETGRTHQIRVHAAHLGVPVVGDDSYGNRVANKTFAAMGLKRLFLHAHVLSFIRPGSGEDFHASAPLDDSLKDFLNQL